MRAMAGAMFMNSKVKELMSTLGLNEAIDHLAKVNRLH